MHHTISATFKIKCLQTLEKPILQSVNPIFKHVVFMWINKNIIFSKNICTTHNVSVGIITQQYFNKKMFVILNININKRE